MPGNDTATRVQAFLADPATPLAEKQEMFSLLPGVDPDLRARVGAFLADPNTPDAEKHEMLALMPQRAAEPAGTRTDLLNLGRNLASRGTAYVKEEGPVMTAATVLPWLAGPEVGLPARALLAGGGAVLGRLGQRLATGQEPPGGAETAMLFAGGAGGEATTAAFHGLMSKIFGVSPKMGAQEFANRAAAERLGIDYLPGDVNPNVARVQADLGRFAGGEEQLARATARRGKQTAQAAERVFLDPLGGAKTGTEAGESIRELARPTLSRVKALGRDKYAMAEAQARVLHLETPVPATITDTADQVLGLLDEGGLESAQAGRARKILEELRTRGQPTTSTSPLVGLGGHPITTTTPAPPLSFQELIGLKRDLNEVLPSFERRGVARDYSTGALEHLHGQLDQLIRDTAKGTPVEPLYAEASDYWRDEVAPLRKWVEKVTPRSDDEVLDLLVHAKRPDRLRILFGQLERSPEGTQAANELRASWFTRALDESTDPKTGLDAERFLSRWNRLGPEVQTILKGSRARDVDELLGVLEGQAGGTGLGRNPSRTAGTLLRGAQRTGQGLLGLSTLNALFQGNPAAAAKALALGGTVTAAPSLLSSLMLSGPGRAYLTGGLPPVPGAGLATRAAAQAIPLSVLRALRRPDTPPPR